MDFNSDVVEASKKGLVVVDFYADWCGPCRMLGPILEKTTKEYGFKLVKVNVDEESDLASEFGVMSIPNVVFFKDGKQVDGFTGAYPEATVRQKLEKYK